MQRHDLFISHSSGDAPVARELRAALEVAGYACFMAPDDVTGTGTWTEQILDAIATSRAMVVLVSAQANRSTHVAREVNLALGRGHPVLPIRIEPVGPTGSLEYLLSLVQRVDAFPPPIASHADAILRRINAILRNAPDAPGTTPGDTLATGPGAPTGSTGSSSAQTNPHVDPGPSGLMADAVGDEAVTLESPALPVSEIAATAGTVFEPASPDPGMPDSPAGPPPSPTASAAARPSPTVGPPPPPPRMGADAAAASTRAWPGRSADAAKPPSAPTAVHPPTASINQMSPASPAPRSHGPVPPDVTSRSHDGPRRGRRGLVVVAGAGAIGLLALAAMVAFGGLLGPGSATPTPSYGGAAHVEPSGSLEPDSPVPSPSPSPMPSPSPSPSPFPIPTVQPSSSPSPTPSRTPSPKPTPSATPKPDTAGPTGGKFRLAGGKSLTTTLKVKLTVTTKPTDPSGVTWMAVSNTSTRPTSSPGLRRYDKSFTWTLSGTKAGKRKVYVWFRDGSANGNWSGPITDTITFDHAPVIDNGIVFRPTFCDGTHKLDLLATPRYAATDADGQGTIKVTRVWTGGSTFPGTTNLSNGITSDGKYVNITISNAAGKGDFTLTDYFTVRNSYGVERSGYFKIAFTGC